MAANPIVDSRDTKFILFEMFEVDKLTKYEKFADFDKDTMESVVDLAEKIAVEQVYPINAAADKNGAKYDAATKKVTIPQEYFPGLKAYYDAGFIGVATDPQWGGMGMPESIYYTVTDYFTAASCAFTMFPMLSIGACNMYMKFLPDYPWKKAVIEKMLTGEWGGTMCLTEPDAGSDVGALKTKATKNADGTYSIKGQKIFISAGDNDFSKNIIHPVLARIEGDPEGTKGISIFLVPKYRIKDDGSIGEPNDVQCAGIEHKMGIHGNPTCTMVFGDEGKCQGFLMGEARQGMKIMFQMMNEARLYVGGQGASVSSAAYMHAVTYARNRVQGKRVEDMMKPDAKNATIMNHPDVRRMLLSMKARVEAMRTLTLFCGYVTDLVHVEKDTAKKEAQALLDFLIPINKAGNTDSAWEVTADAIQCYGGYGFCSDYPVEQYARDAKILTLYEGTNGIQSMDLAMRKLLMDKDFYNYSVYKKKIEDTIKKAKGVVDDKYIAVMEKGVAKIDEVVKYMKGLMDGGKYLHIFANATPMQQAFAMLSYAFIHLWALTLVTPKAKEMVGDKKGADLEKLLADNMEAAYYYGRMLSAQFYIGAEFQKFFGKCDYILAGEAAVVKSTSAIFTGAPEQ
ncbi:MAG TPA: acyl-CoA dehydrogenase [Spirochaetota bacterium]|nr:acyl-CoA dehydrogenase [Spirochaetota bacterium]HPC41457.1 acyl-CoA dehydrogenase [Spirochaetota bacterium]HQF10457.1 acyl-CoA dehydrogenase [Spirochaetota bacterium]HQH99422.1 acyl-CoA dehydrogenase [Spirochaetota bacterium]HQJ69954.1 acyl-CoA dehydrogenase [Spirochaetota bacterium]